MNNNSQSTTGSSPGQTRNEYIDILMERFKGNFPNSINEAYFIEDYLTESLPPYFKKEEDL